ncbi:MAG: tetratricopeptide repeat protein [Acidobacteria bacterium]|nr:tetratricopeptide repeat protein [Acidobacteriota bacterium]
MKKALEGGDVDAAVAAGEKAVKLAPSSAEVFHWMGRSYGSKALEASIFTKISWGKKCRDAWERAALLEPTNIGVRMDLIRFHMLAPGIAGGDKEKAKQQAAEIAKLDAGRGHLASGMIARMEKDLPLAEKEYRKAYEMDAVRGFQPLGMVLIEQKKYDDAFTLVREASGKLPESPWPKYVLGRVALSSGRELEKGLEALDKALAVPATSSGVVAAPDPPSLTALHWTRGLLLEKLGRKPQALAALTEAQKLAPKNEALAKDLKRVKG